MTEAARVLDKPIRTYARFARAPEFQLDTRVLRVLP